MSFRLPCNLPHGRMSGTAIDALEVELLAEKAAALGRAGRKVEAALSDLARCGAGVDRPSAVIAAAQAVHALFIQRELLGFHRQADAVERYAIPREVLAKVGVR